MAISDFNADFNNDFGPIATTSPTVECCLDFRRKSKADRWETLVSKDVVHIQTPYPTKKL